MSFLPAATNQGLQRDQLGKRIWLSVSRIEYKMLLLSNTTSYSMSFPRAALSID